MSDLIKLSDHIQNFPYQGQMLPVAVEIVDHRIITTLGGHKLVMAVTAGHCMINVVDMDTLESVILKSFEVRLPVEERA